MMSPAQRHKARMLGELAAAADPAGAPARTGEAASEYQLMRVRLGVDLRRLGEIESIERRIVLKRELLPGYADWVAGVLAADSPVDDDIVVHVMIWLIDVGDIDAALPVVRHVLKHGLKLPERYKSSPATLVVDNIADAALKRLGQDVQDLGEIVVMVDRLERLDILVDPEDVDMFDVVRAKLEKAIGLATLRRAELTPEDSDGPAGAQRALRARALDHLKRAYALDDGCGVKTRIDRLERELKRDAPSLPVDNAAIADHAVALGDALSALSAAHSTTDDLRSGAIALTSAPPPASPASE